MVITLLCTVLVLSFILGIKQTKNPLTTGLIFQIPKLNTFPGAIVLKDGFGCGEEDTIHPKSIRFSR